MLPDTPLTDLKVLELGQLIGRNNRLVHPAGKEVSHA